MTLIGGGAAGNQLGGAYSLLRLMEAENYMSNIAAVQGSDNDDYDEEEEMWDIWMKTLRESFWCL